MKIHLNTLALVFIPLAFSLNAAGGPPLKQQSSRTVQINPAPEGVFKAYKKTVMDESQYRNFWSSTLISCSGSESQKLGHVDTRIVQGKSIKTRWALKSTSEGNSSGDTTETILEADQGGFTLNVKYSNKWLSRTKTCKLDPTFTGTAYYHCDDSNTAQTQKQTSSCYINFYANGSVIENVTVEEGIFVLAESHEPINAYRISKSYSNGTRTCTDLPAEKIKKVSVEVVTHDIPDTWSYGCSTASAFEHTVYTGSNGYYYENRHEIVSQ